MTASSLYTMYDSCNIMYNSLDHSHTDCETCIYVINCDTTLQR